MKHRSTTLIATLTVLAAMILSVPAHAQRQGKGRSGSGTCATIVADYFDQLETTPLEQGDIDALNHMREEEKLARDVYLTLGDRWALPIFFNIANSEQRHMDRVLTVMDLYDVPDPVVDDTVGVFVDENLAGLYTALVDQGSVSLEDALMVGATIEDLDLYDLYELIAFGTNDHLLFTWQNLAKGSRNHLRAFIGALEAQSGTYVPQYLDEETFDAILASEWERGIVYDADGEILAQCGGMGGRGAGSGTGTCDGTGPGGNGGTGNGGSGNGNPGGGSGNGDCDGSGNP